MISVVYCTKESKPSHKEHIIKSSGLHKHIEVIEIINNGESLTKCYNRGLDLATNNIVVFCHDDIIIETKQWGNKLIKIFTDNIEYGIIGVAGSKYLSTTGRWWDNRKTMYGRVNHTHNGKKWLSAYSPDQGNGVEEVINIDGVFFCVHKERIKHKFDETVEGFHFYDVDFSFQNYISGVKIGVITKIKINHFSIGETNDEWENNRKLFSEKYKDKLPKRVIEKFESNRQLKIMIPHINDNHSLTKMIDLATNLNKLNCSVAIISTFDYQDIVQIKRNRIKAFTLQEPPHFRLGDGKFTLQTQSGPIVSEIDKLYKVSQSDYDIVFTDNIDLLNAYKNMYPECCFVDLQSNEYIEMDKTPQNYKELFVKIYNEETIN